MAESDLLIDFGSPQLPESGHHYADKIPLIPCPPKMEMEDNNPFDVVANFAEANGSDPFEAVFQSTLNADKKSTPKASSEGSNQTKLQLSDSNSSQDSSYLSGSEDFSQESLISKNEEGIRELVAKRVTKCIQQALNNSRSLSDLQKKPENSPKTMPKRHRRSMSATALMLSNINSIRDNTPTTVVPNINQNKYLMNRSFSGSPSTDVFDTLYQGFIKEDKHSKEPEFDMEFICKEAQRLSRLVSKMVPAEAEDENDLLTMQPKWDPPLFSETDTDNDDELPSIKLHHSTPGKTTKTDIENRDKLSVSASEAFIRFKKKYRASLNSSASETTIQNQEEGPEFRRTQSEGSLKVEKSEQNEVVEKKVPLTLPVAEVIGDGKLKIKKPTAELQRCGPLKAFIPIQNMTKKIAVKLSSPFKNSPKKKSSKLVKAQTPENSFTSGHPIGGTPKSSKTSPQGFNTPNGINAQSRLSRRDFQGSGKTKRSSSVNSTLSTSAKVGSARRASEMNTAGVQRPKTAPSPSSNVRALVDISKPFTSPQQNLKKPFQRLTARFKKSGGICNKENQILTA